MPPDGDGEDEPLSKREQIQRRKREKKADRGKLDDAGPGPGPARDAAPAEPAEPDDPRDRLQDSGVDPGRAVVTGVDDFGWRYVYWGQVVAGLVAGAVAWAAIAHLLSGGDPRGLLPHALVGLVVGTGFAVYLNNLYKDAPLTDYSKVCPACGGPVNRYSEFCEHCGTDLVYPAEVVECRSCGEAVYADAPYCPICGAEVAGEPG